MESLKNSFKSLKGLKQQQNDVTKYEENPLENRQTASDKKLKISLILFMIVWSVNCMLFGSVVSSNNYLLNYMTACYIILETLKKVLEVKLSFTHIFLSKFFTICCFEPLETYFGLLF